MTRIRRFAPGQTAKVLGVLYFVFGAFFAPVFIVVSMLSQEGEGFPFVLVIVIPVFYGVSGAVLSAIACALYNLVAGWVGGIEVELSSPGDIAS